MAVASIDFGMVRCQFGMEAVLSLLGFTCSRRRGGKWRRLQGASATFCERRPRAFQRPLSAGR